MKINLLRINKEVLIDCLNEENNRDDFTRNTLARQIEDHQTYGKQEEFEHAYTKYLHKKDYFNYIINIIPDVDTIEETDEELIQFWNDLIEHQKYISKSRINDWTDGGEMYLKCKENDHFYEVCQKIIKNDLSKINCMYIIDTMIKFNEYDNL